jgi:hypothetical protein
MKKLKILSSVAAAGAILTCSSIVFNTPLFASNIKTSSQLKSRDLQGQRMEIIHKFMKEEINSGKAAPKIVAKLGSLSLIPASINAASMGDLRSTINKVCRLYETSKLKKALMNLDESPQDLNNFINTLDPSLQLNAGEKEIFKDLFEGIKEEDYTKIP